jgi:acyl-CoA reductase-like NAD-dependent aldehyde dehydrogenase
VVEAAFGASGVVMEEVFGPVVVLQTYPDGAGADLDDDAAAAAATAAPTLSAAVWASDTARAERFAAAVRIGQVRISGAPWDHRLPFGGFGAAGFGREWGREGIEAFTTTKAVVRTVVDAV